MARTQLFTACQSENFALAGKNRSRNKASRLGEEWNYVNDISSPMNGNQQASFAKKEIPKKTK